MNDVSRFSFLNTAEALGYCGGDAEFYGELLEVFCMEAQPEKIEKLFREADWQNYRIRVHSLKNETRSIGADALSAQAKVLEDAARAEDTAVLLREHPQMLKALNELLSTLRAELNL